jgi:hypothetical protein
VKGGNTVIAFVDDPTGYKWELIQRPPPIPEPVAQARAPDLAPAGLIVAHALAIPKPIVQARA